MSVADARVWEERATESRSLPRPQSTIEARLISSIVIGKRHRTDLGDIDALARSIAEVGLLHPIVIRADGKLVAGERRLEACKRLGCTTIPVTVLECSPDVGVATWK
jgi:ParB-like chromosome segregation protein Spo0J